MPWSIFRGCIVLVQPELAMETPKEQTLGACVLLAIKYARNFSKCVHTVVFLFEQDVTCKSARHLPLLPTRGSLSTPHLLCTKCLHLTHAPPASRKRWPTPSHGIPQGSKINMTLESEVSTVRIVHQKSLSCTLPMLYGAFRLQHIFPCTSP